jgi:hypothetical protein
MYARALPYAGVSTMSVALSVSTKGCGLAIDPAWPPAVSALMRDCWEVDPHKRPSMRHVHDRLAALLDAVEREAAAAPATAASAANGLTTAGGSAGVTASVRSYSDTAGTAAPAAADSKAESALSLSTAAPGAAAAATATPTGGPVHSPPIYTTASAQSALVLAPPSAGTAGAGK